MQTYVVAIMDSHTRDLVEFEALPTMEGTLEINLPEYFQRYDAEYLVEIYLKDGEEADESPIRGNLVWTDGLAIYRPYVDPASLMKDDDTLEDMEFYEQAARTVIDSIITDGFYYKRTIAQTEGLGLDYIPLPYRLCKDIKVIDNDVVTFDAENTDEDWTNADTYVITSDSTAITRDVSNYQGYNRYQARPTRVRPAWSDTWSPYDDASPEFVRSSLGGAMYSLGGDFTFVVETGWPYVPTDIKLAMKLLVKDLKCGGFEYTNRYVAQFTGDQFGFKFDAQAFVATGNMAVDKILGRYVRQFNRASVL